MTIGQLTDIFQFLSLVVTTALLFIRPFREWFFGRRKKRKQEEEEENLQREVIRCLLRDAILRIYNEHSADKKLNLFDYQNLDMLHTAYKKEDGNSFVDHIWDEIQNEWDTSP